MGTAEGVTALGALVTYWLRGSLGVSCHLCCHRQKGEPGALGMGHALWIFQNEKVIPSSCHIQARPSEKGVGTDPTH